MQFEQGSDTLSNDARTGLRMFATALREANPSAPLVPLGVTGFASPEGDATRNADLSRRRADVVKSFLEGQGVRQPVSASSGGTTGPASDPAGRKAEIRVDRIAGDRVLLEDGPPAGTKVVTVGAGEVYGTELDIASG